MYIYEKGNENLLQFCILFDSFDSKRVREREAHTESSQRTKNKQINNVLLTPSARLRFPFTKSPMMIMIICNAIHTIIALISIKINIYNTGCSIWYDAMLIAALPSARYAIWTSGHRLMWLPTRIMHKRKSWKKKPNDRPAERVRMHIRINDYFRVDSRIYRHLPYSLRRLHIRLRVAIRFALLFLMHANRWQFRCEIMSVGCVALPLNRVGAKTVADVAASETTEPVHEVIPLLTINSPIWHLAVDHSDMPFHRKTTKTEHKI